MDPSAARYLEQLAAEVTAVVGDRLVGVYAHGSLLLGGYLPERSDIDVLVVVEAALSPDERAALARRLSEEALPCPAMGLELSVLLRSVAAHPVARCAFELHVTTEYAVLNACRAWRYAVEGDLVSKVDGGRWALELVPPAHRPLVEAALARQTATDPTAPLDADMVRAFLSSTQDVIRIVA